MSNTSRASAHSGGEDGPHVVLVHRAADAIASVANRLNQTGYVAAVAHSEAAFWQVMNERVCVVLLELMLPGNEEARLLHRIRELYPEVRILITFNESERRQAFVALDRGASETLSEPLDVEMTVLQVVKAAQAMRLVRENRELRSMVDRSIPVPPLAGHSAGFRQLMNQVALAAKGEAPVLLQGEPGTGKSTLARWIHQRGTRSYAPFVVVNCCGLSRDLIEAELFGQVTDEVSRPGRAELAQGGTLFLNEISALPLTLQPRIVTLLQERYVQRMGSTERKILDVRVIAASSRNLHALSAAQAFSVDLVQRLNVVSITVPALRARREDLPELAASVLSRWAARQGVVPPSIPDDVLKVFAARAWPGNIRELENVLELAIVRSGGGRLTVEDLPNQAGHTLSEMESARTVPHTLAGMTLAEVEKHAIVDTLHACKGNKARAARELGISEKSIYNKMKRLGIPKYVAGAHLEGADNLTSAASMTVV